MIRQLALLATFLAAPSITAAQATQAPLQDAAQDWATTHMSTEHHINNYDPAAFFSLHDYDSDGMWEAQEILRTYGCADDSSDGMGSPDHNGFISRDEWITGNRDGKRLPDFGMGTGHHGDAEYEYEIHHFEKYHNENTTEEDLTHPEDIAHFKLHDQHEDEEARQAVEDRMNVVPRNIPAKFLRTG